MSGTVFISHSHEDNDLCAPLLEALKAWGVDCWIDLGRLAGGDPIADKIWRAIRERDIFLRICTPAAMTSRYMDRELDFFLQLQDAERKAHGASRRKLVPLILATPYDGGLPEAGVKYISAIDRPRSEWLNELRAALDVPLDATAGHTDEEAGAGIHLAEAADQDRPHGSHPVDKSPGLVAMLGEMDAAIAAELKKVERSTRGYVAEDGRFVGRVGGQCLYTFALRELWEPQDDTPIRVKVTSQRQVDASVVTSSGNSVTISVSQQLPEQALRQVTLVDDPRRLLEKLREALDEVQESEAQLASKAFTLMPARTGAAPLPGLPPQFRPTASQQQAMQQALGNEVSYIVGPPGTGKTATLAAIAFALVKAGRTVLIAAHTNIAVDNAILKLAEYADGLPDLQEGRIVRFGPPQLAAVREHAAIFPPNIAKRVGRDLDAQKAGIQAARATALAELQAIHDARGEEAQHWGDERGRLSDDITRMQAELGPLQQQEQARLAGLQAQLTQAAREVDTAEEQVNLAKKALAQLVERQSRLTSAQDRLQADEVAASARLAEAQRMHPVIRVVRRVSRERLVQHLSDLKQELWEVGQALEALQQPLASAHAERAGAEKAHSRAQTHCAALWDELRRPSEFAARLQELLDALQTAHSLLQAGDASQRRRTQERDTQQRRLRQDIERLNADLADIEARLADVERDIVAHAQVVATTLSKLYMGATLRDRAFDVVILDEVSIAPLPAVYIAATMATERVVVIGDPKQLSPIVQAENDPLARKWLGRDLFEVARVTLDGAVHGDVRSVLLDEQFRMDPAISIIARTHVYEGLLRDGKQQQGVSPAYASVSPLPGKPLVLCDTSEAHPLTARPESGKGRYNEYHVMCVLALAKQALATLPPARPANGTSKFRIGIVTPYRAQAQRIQRALKAEHLVESVRAGTIYSFQGLEFEVVIFDTVESPQLRPVPDFTAGGRGSKAMRLVNVAVTRPQHKLIIVANLYVLADKPVGEGYAPAGGRGGAQSRDDHVRRRCDPSYNTDSASLNWPC